MRKWKCVKSNSIYFTIGRIYETDENGDGLTDDSNSGRRWTDPWRFKLGGFNGAEFEEVFKEEEKKVNKFKIGDVVKGNKLSNKYCLTDTRVLKAKVISINKDGEIKIEILEYDGSDRVIGEEYDGLDMECFDLVLKSPKTKTLTITTSDSTTTLTDGTHTTTINRYYTDKHNERNAVSIVTDKYFEELTRIEREKNTPKVGDKVRVVDANDVYPNYRDWLITNNVPIRTALKWKDNNKRFTQTEYKVIVIHPHSIGSKRMLALIEGEYEAFIIGIEGLEVVK